MNLLKKFTTKNLLLNKKRTIVTIIGIILSVALITAVSTIYKSGIDSLINFETEIKGNFHTVFHNVEEKDLYLFKNNRKIENVFLTKDLGYSKINSKNEYKPYVFIKAFTKESMENLTVNLIEGEYPENENEILIPSHLKTNGRIDLKVGDTLTLNIGKRISKSDNVELDQSNPLQTTLNNEEEEIINEIIEERETKTYKIVGIMERPASNIEPYSAPGYTLITYTSSEKINGVVDVYAKYNKAGTKDAYKLTASILGVDGELFEKYYTATATNDEVKKYIQNYSPKEKYKININNYLITLETNPLSDSSTGGLGVVVVIVILIIIFTSVFCIKNSFDISITEKTREYGMLRSIGATKKQIKKTVFFEGTVLGLIGIPLGILCGLFASYILIIVSNFFLKDMLNTSLKLVYSLSLISIIISLILGIITIYLSSFRSAKRASKISPIDLIRNSGNIKIKRKSLKTPKIINKLFGIGGVISYKNIKRNKKKYRTTTLSIIISVFVFIALSSFMSDAFSEIDNELKISEYNLSLYTSKIENDKELEMYIETTNLDNIENYSVIRSVGFNYKNRILNPEYIKFLNLKIDENKEYTEYINIYTLGTTQYKKYIKELGLNYDEISDKGILMDYVTVGYQKSSDKKMTYKTLRYTGFNKGDTLYGTLNNKADYNIEIGLITDKKPFGFKNYQNTYLIISEELFNKITKNDLQDLTIYYKSSNATKLQDDIDELLKGKDYNLTNSEENVNMMNNLFTLIGIFLYGFIIVISLIGITNIFNTITTSMELRKREFATLKSIGMTTKEFNKMIRFESIFIGIKSLIFGIPIGVALSYLIHKLFNSPVPYKLPILAILISSLVVFLLITLIMKYSISKINKQNVVETIRKENI